MNKDNINTKFKVLNDTFDMAEDTLNDIQIEVDKMCNTGIDIYKTPIENDSESTNTSDLVPMEMLRSDFTIIRETLISNVLKGKLIINTITDDVISGNIIDARSIEAVANLIRATNGSLKELSNIFKEFQDIDDTKKKNKTDNSNSSNTQINNTQNIFVGTSADLLDLLK